MKTRIVLLGLSVVLAAGNVFARPVREWTYRELLDESDLVVIAAPMRTEPAPAAEKTWSWQEMKPEHVRLVRQLLERPPGPDLFLLDPIETTFEVRAVVKGKLDAPRLGLIHFRWRSGDAQAREVAAIDFTPNLLKFPLAERPAKSPIRESEPAGRAWLLFLKARKDGKYEPVSGQTDPIDSARRILPADDSQLEEKKMVEKKMGG